MTQVDPTPDVTTSGSEHPEFGADFVRLVLHRQRVLDCVDRVLGESFVLGPIGAGPGRKLARVTARGRYGKAYGRDLPGGEPGHLVFVPVDVDFDLDVQVETLRFHAAVLVPLEIRLRLERPITIVWDITTPTVDQVQLVFRTDNRRSALVQRVAGIDEELRRFLLRFITKELDKPHVRRATRIDLERVIDAAWPVISDQFLPTTPEDRLG